MTRTALKTGICLGALWVSSLAVLSAPSVALAQEMPHSYLVFFDFDKSDLTPEAIRIVDQAAANAAMGKVTKIEVTGYTDTSGSAAYNMRLSQRRALAVQAELTSHGVSAGEISIIAKGESDLLVPTADGVKEPQNRRVQVVYTQMAPPAPPPAPAAAVVEEEVKEAPGFTLGALLEGGITGNMDAPPSRQNFGHLVTNPANQLLLNQLAIVAEKPIDSSVDYSAGFKFYGYYGADARILAFMGLFDQAIKERNQIDILDANVVFHTPWVGEGGMDIRAGLYVTPQGFETNAPDTNVFYSKSYIFYFGSPYKHTGVMTTTHLNPTIDIYAGIDTGLQTTLGDGDNNGSISFQAGIGLNGLLDGKVSIVALTHIGPETPGNNSAYRYLSNIVTTYKASDVLTLYTEMNYAQDELINASAWGIAQYASYALNEQVTLSGRVEYFDDHNNYFLGAFPGNRTYMQFGRGLPLDSPPIFAPAAGQYGEITLGVTYKPMMPNGIQALMIRPEIRYDSTLNSVNAYKDGTKSSQFTIGLDFVLKI